MKREDNAGDNRNKFYVILLILILFMLCVITILMLIPKGNCCMGALSKLYQNGNVGGGVDLKIESNGDSVTSGESGDNEQGVAISGITSITLPKNEKQVYVDFCNPEKNKDLYYQTFELRLVCDGGYETLYTSGLVEPGEHIRHITLSRTLESGEYQAVVHVQPYRMNEERTPTNNVDIKTALIVK